MMTGQDYHNVRPSAIAGRWYTANPTHLTATLSAMLDNAPRIEVPGSIVGLVVPHAGYMYSGPVAARAFKQIKGMSFEYVVVVSPMHHPYPNALLSTSHDAYETPLGLIEVDHDTLEALNRHIPITPVSRDPEHALEIELPFLQLVLTEPFRLVPLMIRKQTSQVCLDLGRAIVREIIPRGSTLLIASSDLSHYYADHVARQLDEVMLAHIAAGDPEQVIRADQSGEAFACGRGAIATVLEAARQMGAAHIQIVGYATSADMNGEYHRVVGYGAAVISRLA